MKAETIIKMTETKLLTECHKSLKDANAVQIHNALSGAVMEAIAPLWNKKETERKNDRQAYYISMEYLVGRLVYNNLYCMRILNDVKQIMADKGVDITILEDIEDAAFGNGGLGRLAACYLDSAVTCNIPLTGYGLRFKYGLFRQVFSEGFQKEEPDDWARFGDPWSIRRLDEAVTVSMKTGNVLAVPYDMPVIGYGMKNIGTLRLWQAESLHEINFSAFNRQDYVKASEDKNRAEDITKFLYPNDSGKEGKLLRIKQQYFLVSATVQDLLKRYRNRHGSDYSFFSEENAIQLNDTHPVMAIPELIRLLEIDGVPFDRAFSIARDTFAYTNHTVMQEALEKWDLSLLSSVCPDIVHIIKKIDHLFCKEMKTLHAEVLSTRCIIENRRVHMAQLAVYATHTTNGVAVIHSEILKNDVFADWYCIYPDRFQNKTNGITQRRWLGLCNPELCGLIESKIGHGYETDLIKLKKLIPMIDSDMCQAFRIIKNQKKKQLVKEISHKENMTISENMVFDVQIKRLHEYKRQFLNALSILAIYDLLKSGQLPDFPATAFIFGAKSAPGYDRAKAIIHWINMIADKVNSDPDISQKMKVVFVQNYNCSWAEKIIPATDISEQISPAGTEASGTGNMKFMLNGAVTLGTFDGANVEIVEEAGRENNYIFGATVEELNQIRDSYDPKLIYRKDPLLRRCLNTLTDGTFPDQDGMLKELSTSILEGASWHKPDHYFVLYDFSSYLKAKLQAIYDAGTNSDMFVKKCLINVACSGKFSSDRSVREYAKEIWHV